MADPKEGDGSDSEGLSDTELAKTEAGRMQIINETSDVIFHKPNATEEEKDAARQRLKDMPPREG
jgi:hypothetical protein